MRLLVAVSIALLACTKQPEARRVVPPSEQEAEAFAKDFVTHLAPCDGAEIDERVDRDLLFARSFAKRRISDSAATSFKRGFGGVGTVLCRQLGAQANVAARYLRLHTVDGTPRPLVRLIIDGAVNYHELELDKRGGTVRVADITNYMAGERLSDTVGTMLDLLLDSGGGEAKTTMETMKRVNQHRLANEWKEAHAAFETLPAAFRGTKPLRLLEVQLTAEIDDASYLAAMDGFTKAFPNDPALVLIQIDRSLLRKEYAETLRFIDLLDKRVGGDPYLDVLRADALGAQGKLPEALEAATRASQAAPDLVASWWALLSQQTANQRYADTLPTLEVLRDKFAQDVSAATLGGDERFGALVASPEFTAWAAR